jgi:hypothetical protein
VAPTASSSQFPVSSSQFPVRPTPTAQNVAATCADLERAAAIGDLEAAARALGRLESAGVESGLARRLRLRLAAVGAVHKRARERLATWPRSETVRVLIAGAYPGVLEEISGELVSLKEEVLAIECPTGSTSYVDLADLAPAGLVELAFPPHEPQSGENHLVAADFLSVAGARSEARRRYDIAAYHGGFVADGIADLVSLAALRGKR